MPDPIFVIVHNEKLIRVDQSPYAKESILQKLISDHPEIIPGSSQDGAPDRRWLLVRREAGIPNEEGGGNWWAVDHLLLDQAGVPTFVEVKRSEDTRARREVVAQMLDYVANATAYWQVGTLKAWYEEEVNLSKADPEAFLAEFLADGELDTDTFWNRVEENLRSSRVRCIFVSDSISPSLIRLVEFLNEQLQSTEVLAVELPQYIEPGEGNLVAIVPKLVGRTSKASAAKNPGVNSPTRYWDRDSFISEIRSRISNRTAEFCEEVLAWAEQRKVRVTWGHGLRDGSMILAAGPTSTGNVFATIWTYGRIEFDFQYLMKSAVFGELESRRELLCRINEIPRVSIGEESLDKRPNLPLDIFLDESSGRLLFGVFTWLAQELNRVG